MGLFILYSILVVAAYLVGSIPFGLILTKVFGKVDIRSQGSGNIGATNVFRVAGKWLGILTLILDMAKGILPVLLVKSMIFIPLAVEITALACVVGHMFPVWLKGKGGKGVATAFGVLWAMSPWLGGIFTVTWLGVFWLFRFSSLASLIAITITSAMSLIMLPFLKAIFVVLMALLIVLKHKQNIKRLLSGQEPKFRSQ